MSQRGSCARQHRFFRSGQKSARSVRRGERLFCDAARRHMLFGWDHLLFVTRLLFNWTPGAQDICWSYTQITGVCI